MNSDTAPDDGPIIRRKLYEEVVQRLMQRIDAGDVVPGDHLPSERELMAQYGVGRVAVREALQALERSGIVEISHGERARVALPTARVLIDQMASGARHLLRQQPQLRTDLRDARLFLETGVVRRAAQRATAADVERLWRCWEAQAEALQDLDQFVDRDRQFHAEVARIAGNPILAAAVDAVFEWAMQHHRTIVRAPGAEALTLAEHKAIIEAIAARKPEAAEAALAAHLNRSNALYGPLQPVVPEGAGGGPA